MADNIMSFSELKYLMKKYWYILVIAFLIGGSSYFVIHPKYVGTLVIHTSEGINISKEKQRNGDLQDKIAINNSALLMNENIVQRAMDRLGGDHDAVKIYKNIRFKSNMYYNDLVLQYRTYNKDEIKPIMDNVSFEIIGTMKVYNFGINYKPAESVAITSQFSNGVRAMYAFLVAIIMLFLGMILILVIDSIKGLLLMKGNF